MEELERITARRSELDVLAEELTRRLQEVHAEREELAFAERVLDLQDPHRGGPSSCFRRLTYCRSLSLRTG